MEAPLAIRVKPELNHRVGRRSGEEVLDLRARRPRARYAAEGSSSEQVIAGKAEWRPATTRCFAARSVRFGSALGVKFSNDRQFAATTNIACARRRSPIGVSAVASASEQRFGWPCFGRH